MCSHERRCHVEERMCGQVLASACKVLSDPWLNRGACPWDSEVGIMKMDKNKIMGKELPVVDVS